MGYVQRLVTTMAMISVIAFLGASSAAAETTAICSVDEDPCSEANLVHHLHGISIKSVLLTNILNVECEALALGDVKSPYLGSPLTIVGTVVFSNCKSSSGTKCEVTELNGPSKATVLRIGPEEAEVTGVGEALDQCGVFIHCIYNGEGVRSVGKGSLIAGGNGNGLIGVQEQSLHKVGGTLCPKTSKLDGSAEELSPIYISS